MLKRLAFVIQMDDMDMILMQPSTDKDDFPKISKSFSFSPRQNQLPAPPIENRVNRNPLKFHLNTSDSHGGYMLSLSQTRIKSFRVLLERSGLNQISAETACNEILSRGSRTRITKAEFDSAVQSMLSPSIEHDRQSERIRNDVFSGIFAAFDRDCKNEASALEVACGFTVLCRGKKSDKLEFAFEVLDKNKRGRLATNDMASYLQSFLSVLLSIAYSPSLENDPIDDTVVTMSGWRCDRTIATLIQAAKAGADWAASLAFRDFERNNKQSPSMSFDDFADWYTSVGYSSIPWLELLDLQKWAITSETK
jgi:Ca2+-binding EF-hand superfamily protein